MSTFLLCVLFVSVAFGQSDQGSGDTTEDGLQVWEIALSAGSGAVALILFIYAFILCRRSMRRNDEVQATQVKVKISPTETGKNTPKPTNGTPPVKPKDQGPKQPQKGNGTNGVNGAQKGNGTNGVSGTQTGNGANGVSGTQTGNGTNGVSGTQTGNGTVKVPKSDGDFTQPSNKPATDPEKPIVRKDTFAPVRPPPKPVG